MTPSDIARQYASDVVGGAIVACQYVKLACQRFLNDLDRQGDDDWPYVFDEAKADRAVKFMQLMPHTKGKWSSSKSKLVFEPWQVFIEANIFGWVKKDTGKRRFREAYEEIPRKNGKSARLAARGIYLFAADGESGAEVYSGATTEKQAFEVFRPAWMMAHKLENLRNRFGIELSGNQKNPGPMFVMEDMSKFETVIGNPGDGASPHAALVDEYHEHDTDALVDTMQTGMGAREQPLLSIITTAGSNLGGPCYEKRRDVIRILEGQTIDETIFGIIYTIDDSEYDSVFRTSAALRRMSDICTCRNVPAGMAAELFARECVTLAIKNHKEKSGSLLLEDAKTTQKGLSKLKGYAGLVTTETSNLETQNTKKDSQLDHQSGQGKTQIERRKLVKSGNQNTLVLSSTKSEEEVSLKPFAELSSMIMSSDTLSSQGYVLSAEFLEKLSASITAIRPEELEGFFASNATLRLAFLETMKKVLSEHSGICRAKNEVKSSDGGEWTFLIPADAWDDPASLIKANPNYGVSVFPDFLLAQLQQAKRSASKQNAFRTKHLNQWVGARTVWMNMLAWQRQKRDFTIADMGGCRCWMALDLASKKDVAALVMLFEKAGQFYCIPRFYAPEAAAEENEKYQNFALEGHLTLTPGSMTDYAFIEADILDLAKQIDLQDVAFDDWQANYLITRLSSTSIPVVDFNQTVKNMSDPMKEVEARVIARTLWHDGNPVMTWMMGNVAAKIDAKENIYPRKENDNDPNCKIDGPVTLIMAMGRALVAGVDDGDDFMNAIRNPIIA